MKLIRKLFEQFDAVLHILCSHYHFHTLAQKATTPSTEVQLTWISNHFCLFDARSEICNAEVANVSNQLCLPVVQWWELPSSFHSYFLWRIFDWKDQFSWTSWWHFMQKYIWQMDPRSKLSTRIAFSPLKVRFQFSVSLELFLKMRRAARAFCIVFLVRRCSAYCLFHYLALRAKGL